MSNYFNISSRVAGQWPQRFKNHFKSTDWKSTLSHAILHFRVLYMVLLCLFLNYHYMNFLGNFQDKKFGNILSNSLKNVGNLLLLH